MKIAVNKHILDNTTNTTGLCVRKGEKNYEKNTNKMKSL